MSKLKTPKQFLQDKYEYMRKFWNQNPHIDDEWVASQMEEYSNYVQKQANELLPHANTRFPEKEDLENECTAYMDSVIKETDYRDRPIHLKYAFKAGVNYLNEFLNGC